MKSPFQISSFLSQYAPKSTLDSEMISSFLEKRYKGFRTPSSFTMQSSLPPLDAQSLIQWLESGVGSTEIVMHGGRVGVLGQCGMERAVIVGTLSGSEVIPRSETVEASGLSKATESDTETFYKALYASRLQFDQASLTLVKKYIPSPNEKVIFYNNDFSQCGIGVLRSIDENTGDIEMYCYYLYPPANTVGYSMHEKGIVNIVTHIFEPMLEDDKRSSKMNGVSCLRRLNSELGKKGKVWKDKIKRIEPVSYELEEGKDYWFINDEFKVEQKKEKGTPTSHFRYLAGNYFVTKESAETMREKIVELIQSYLSSPDWPNN